MKRRSFTSTAVLAALGATAGCMGRAGFRDDEVSHAVERSYDPADVREIVVKNRIGGVTVSALDVATIEARVIERSTNGQAGLDDIDVTTTVDDGVLTVQTAIDGDARWFTLQGVSGQGSSTSAPVSVDLRPSSGESITSRSGGANRILTEMVCET